MTGVRCVGGYHCHRHHYRACVGVRVHPSECWDHASTKAPGGSLQVKDGDRFSVRHADVLAHEVGPGGQERAGAYGIGWRQRPGWAGHGMPRGPWRGAKDKGRGTRARGRGTERDREPGRNTFRGRGRGRGTYMPGVRKTSASSAPAAAAKPVSLVAPGRARVTSTPWGSSSLEVGRCGSKARVRVCGSEDEW